MISSIDNGRSHVVVQHKGLAAAMKGTVMARLFLGWIMIASTTLLATGVVAGETDVVDVKVRKTGQNTFTFDVTVRHADTGWKHYANKWQVESPDGKVLGTRTLHHPHVDEQPFTRSLSGVKISDAIQSVTVRAFDSKHDDGGATKTVALPR